MEEDKIRRICDLIELAIEHGYESHKRGLSIRQANSSFVRGIDVYIENVTKNKE